MVLGTRNFASREGKAMLGQAPDCPPTLRQLLHVSRQKYQMVNTSYTSFIWYSRNTNRSK